MHNMVNQISVVLRKTPMINILLKRNIARERERELVLFHKYISKTYSIHCPKASMYPEAFLLIMGCKASRILLREWSCPYNRCTFRVRGKKTKKIGNELTHPVTDRLLPEKSHLFPSCQRIARPVRHPGETPARHSLSQV